MSEQKPMRILELRSENVKRLSVVVIRPKSNVVVIQGENGEGKSSILDSIEYTLAGKDAQPPVVIRRGQDFAESELDLGDFIAKRRWTPGGDKLTLETKDGARFNAPQKKLDELLGKISFDPLAFIRLKPKEQQDLVKKLVNVDTTAVEVAHLAAYTARTKVTAEGQAMKAVFEQMPQPPIDTPDVAVDVQALLDEQARLQRVRTQNDSVRSQLMISERAVMAIELEETTAREEFERLEAQLEALQAKRVKIVDRKVEAQKNVETSKAAVAALVDPDVTAIYKQIAGAEAINANVRAKKARAEQLVKLDAKRKEKEGLDAIVNQEIANKADLIAKAKFPIDGMSFSTDGLTFNGLPLEQASSAEQLRVGLALSIALNPTIRVAFIRDGSLLDEKSMDLVERMADSYDMQIWIERVGAGKVGFEIVDGRVISVDGAPVDQPEPRETKPPLVATTDKPALSLVPPPQDPPAAAPPAAAPEVAGPTFKKKPIAGLSPEALAAAVEEVRAAITKAPMTAASTKHRAVLDDLEAEQNRRMAAAMAGTAPIKDAAPPEPGSDG